MVSWTGAPRSESDPRVALLERLARLNLLVSSSPDLDEVLNAIATTAAEVMQAPLVAFWIADESAETLTGAAASDERMWADFPVRRWRFAEQSLSTSVARDRRPLSVPDVYADSRVRNPHWFRAHGLTSYFGIPIVFQDALLGVLNVLGRAPFQVDAAQQGLLEILCAQAAVAIRNARTHAQEQRAREEAEHRALQQAVIAHLGQRALAGTDLDSLMDEAVRLAARTLGVEYAQALEAVPDGTGLRLRAGLGWRAELVAGLLVPADAGSQAGFTLLARRPIVVEDVETEPRFGCAPHQRAHGVVSGASTVIGGAAHPLGVLSVHTASRRTFGDDDLNFLQAVANVLGEAMHRARAEASAAALAAVARTLSETLDSEQVAGRVAQSVCTLLECDEASVARLSPESGDFTVVAVAGTVRIIEPGVVFPAGTGLTGLCIRERRVVTSTDVLNDPRIVWTPEFRERVTLYPFREALAVPLLLGDRLVGALFARRRQPRPFSPDDVRLAQAFADEAALALENAQLYGEVRNELRHSEALLSLSRAIAGTIDLEEALRRVARQTAHALGADTVGAYLAESDGSVLRPRAGYRVPRAVLEAFGAVPFPIKGHEFVEEAWRTGAPVWASDVASDPRIDKTNWSLFPYRSTLLVPLVHQGALIGSLLALWWDRTRTFTREDVRLAEAIGHQAALTLANAKLYGESEQRREQTEALADLTRTINSSLELDVVLQRVADAARSLCGSDVARIALRDPRTGDMLFRYWSGLDGGEPKRHRSEAETWPATRPDDAPARLAVPIVLEDRVAGLIVVDNHRTRPFADGDAEVLQQLGHHAAIALRNAELFTRNERARAEAEVAMERLRGLSRQLVLVQEVERRRLARELHDEIGQALTALKINLQALQRAWQGSPGAERLEDSVAIASGVLEQVRNISVDLRPSILDDFGLVEALRWYVERHASRANLKVSSAFNLDGPLPAEIETACFRLAQEAITNVVRHAGARSLCVELEGSQTGVELCVRDDGAGFDVTAAREAAARGGSLGLLGMQERAQLLGGRMEMISEPGRGTEIRAYFPVPRP